MNLLNFFENISPQQRSVGQLPADFKPKKISPVLDGPYGKMNATQGYLVGEDLKEFAPVGGNDREPDEEEILKQLAAQWWNGTEQQMSKAQKTLAAMGWEIGQDESGDDNAGVFVIRVGDVNGDTYMAFPHSELELNEGVKEAGPYGSRNPDTMSANDYDRYQQDQMDQGKRDFKRQEHEAEWEQEKAYSAKLAAQAAGPWYIRLNGKLIRDKQGNPYTFNSKGAANKAALTMQAKLFNQGKEFMLTTNPNDKPQGVAEASQRVDSLVTDALKIMQGSEVTDAVQALKTVLGDREYNSRRGHYNFYVRQLMDMYGQQGMKEGWKEKLGAAAVTGAMALGSAGANARVTPDGQGGFTGGLKPSATVTAPADNKPAAEAPKGFSKEYLQKAADPNRFGRYMISVEKAQELLKNMQEGMVEGDRTMSRAAKGYEKYGKQGMQALAKAGREGKDLDKVRDKYNKYDESVDQGMAEGVAETVPWKEAQTVLNHYGADYFGTSYDKLYFYKYRKRFSIGLIRDEDGNGNHSVNLSDLNAMVRKLRGMRVPLSPFGEGVSDLSYDAQSLITKLRRDVEEKRLKPTPEAVLAAARELAGDMEFAPQLLVKQVLGQGVAEAAKWRTHTDAHDLDTDGSYIPKGGIKSDNLATRQKASKTQSEKDPKSMAGMFGAKYAKKHGVPTKQLMKNIPLDAKKKEQGVAEGSGDKKPYPNTWHDVDPKISKLVDKMSPEEKVKKGYSNPSILKKKKEQGVAEGWQEDSQELEDWSKEVNKKLYRAHENQRRSLAIQLSKLEQKHFGSELTNGPLTNIVFSTLQALNKGQMVHYDPQSVGQMPFGNIVGDDARIIAASGLSKYDVDGYRGLQRAGIVDTIQQFLHLRDLANNKGQAILKYANMPPVAAWMQFIKDIGWSKDDMNEEVQAKTDDKLLAYYAQRKAEKQKQQQGATATLRPVESQTKPSSFQAKPMSMSLEDWKKEILAKYPNARFATERRPNGSTLAGELSGGHGQGGLGIYSPSTGEVRVGPTGAPSQPLRIHPKQQGMAEDAGDSPVAGAITRRILMQRTDLLSKYGPEKVTAAIDEVADFVGDVDEIGSSDVSGWVRQVEQMLGNMMEGTVSREDQYVKLFRESVASGMTSEDVLSTLKRKLGDYLQDVATAVNRDNNLVGQLPNDIDQIGPAVKTITTDDGREIKIHGNEDDGFRISINSTPMKSKFNNIRHAEIATEMYCAHRKSKSKDYVEEA